MWLRTWQRETFSPAAYMAKGERGSCLGTKLRILWRQKEKMASRKAAGLVKTLKAGVTLVAKKVAYQKKKDKIENDILGLGNGDKILGQARWNARKGKDGAAKQVRQAAALADQPAKVAACYKWRWHSGEGLSYDVRPDAAPMEKPGTRGPSGSRTAILSEFWVRGYSDPVPPIKETKRIRLKQEKALEVLEYLLRRQDVFDIKLTFNTVGAGKRHLQDYALLMVAKDGNVPTDKALTPLYIVAQDVKADAAVSGNITAFLKTQDSLYVNIDNRQITTWRLLPERYREFALHRDPDLDKASLKVQPALKVRCPLSILLNNANILTRIEWRIPSLEPGDRHERACVAEVQVTGNSGLKAVKELLDGPDKATVVADVLAAAEKAAQAVREARRRLARRREAHQGQAKKRSPVRPPADDAKAKYCNQCGRRFILGDRFCGGCSAIRG